MSLALSQVRGLSFKLTLGVRHLVGLVGLLAAVAVGWAATTRHVSAVLVLAGVGLLSTAALTGGLEGLAVCVVLLAFLPIPSVEIGNATFGFATLTAPMLVAAVLLEARRSRLTLQVPHLGLYGAFLAVAALSVAYSWIAWDPGVGTGKELGAGHRWIGYQIAQLYFLVLPMIAFTAGFNYARLRRLNSLLMALAIGLALSVLSSLATWAAHPTNPLDSYQLNQRVGSFDYISATFLTVLGAACLLWSSKPLQKALGIGAAFAGLLGVFIAGYLNPWLAVMAALSVMVWHRARGRGLAAWVAALTALVVTFQSGILDFLLVRSQSSDLDRITLWQDSLRIWLKSPLVGVGSGNLTSYSETYSSFPLALVLQGYHQVHNTFLELLAEDGVIGLLLFLAFLVAVFRSLVVTPSPIGDSPTVRTVALGLLVATVTMGLFASGLVPMVNSAGWTTIGSVTTVWLVVGCAAGGREAGRQVA
jgi:hypothetical protein